MDTNTFTILIKAFIEKYQGVAPSQDQWEMIKTILNDVPTERLCK